jgi:hypothetical protein
MFTTMMKKKKCANGLDLPIGLLSTTINKAGEIEGGFQNDFKHCVFILFFSNILSLPLM